MSNVDLVQQTLTGDPAETERERPRTLVYDPEADEYVLRSRIDWLTFDPDSVSTGGDEDVPHPDIDPDEQVGAWYEIRLSYSTEHTFVIPGFDDWDAKDRAEELVDYGTTADDCWLLHDERHERTPIYRSDLPDDWDYEPITRDLLEAADNGGEGDE